jgi:E3 ubiquitin-protein ligase SHPRH
MLMWSPAHVLLLWCCCLQWCDELLKHIRPGTLSVKVYLGQPQAAAVAAAASSGSDGPSAAAIAAGLHPGAEVLGGDAVVTATQLAAADVVLTTYDVLRKDVAAQPGVEGETRAMRRAKRWA